MKRILNTFDRDILLFPTAHDLEEQLSITMVVMYYSVYVRTHCKYYVHTYTYIPSSTELQDDIDVVLVLKETVESHHVGVAQ